MRHRIDELAKTPDFHRVMSTGKISPCRFFVDDAEQKPQPPEWPAWAKALSASRADGDGGVGDTAERVFGAFGGSAFKAALAAAGIDCGCEARKDRWNALFAY